MRAAVFVNLVTMRKVMDHGGNGHVQLAPCNLEILQKSNYLFHSAHNCPLTLTGRVCVCVDHLKRCKTSKRWFGCFVSTDSFFQS